MKKSDFIKKWKREEKKHPTWRIIVEYRDRGKIEYMLADEYDFKAYPNLWVAVGAMDHGVMKYVPIQLKDVIAVFSM
jgi:hypothetical protein